MRQTVNRSQIKKLYIEPTSRCNFNCKMCPRNAWVDEKIGDMNMDLFHRLMNQAKSINGLETIFFGGVAEPMAHENIVEMVKIAKNSGVKVELISNGSFLNKSIIENLLAAGLDMLWFSIDTDHNDSYDENTRNDGFEKAKSNLMTFNLSRRKIKPDAEFGISFVATKSNSKDLPKIINLGQIMGAREIKISNIIPYEKEMQVEMLYKKSFSMMGFNDDFQKRRRTVIDMPIMDFDLIEPEVLQYVLLPSHTVKLGENMVIRKSGYCKFIASDNVFVKWDGEVCPCIALLHNSKSYLNNVERYTRFCSFGNIKRKNLVQIWEGKEYLNFRTRVKEFSFSPCTICGACSYLETNEEDCFGNLFPTCGGCIWSEGFAQCP